MHSHRTYHDELPLIWTIVIILAAFWLVSCAGPPEPRLTPAQSRAMAEDWAWNGIPPPPGMASSAPWPSSPPSSYHNYSQQRMRTTCMQYGTLGQGGQLSCY